MVLIEVYLKTFKLDDVKEALEELGVGGMTITEVVQVSPSRPRGRSFGAPGPLSDMVPKIKLEIAAPRHLLERIIEAVCLHGSSGRLEDGTIVVTAMEGSVRIRTGESGDEAISM